MIFRIISGLSIMRHMLSLFILLYSLDAFSGGGCPKTLKQQPCDI